MSMVYAEITIQDIDIIGRIGPNEYITTDQVTMISHQQTSQFIFHRFSSRINDRMILKHTYMFDASIRYCTAEFNLENLLSNTNHKYSCFLSDEFKYTILDNPIYPLGCC